MSSRSPARQSAAPTTRPRDILLAGGVVALLLLALVGGLVICLSGGGADSADEPVPTTPPQAPLASGPSIADLPAAVDPEPTDPPPGAGPPASVRRAGGQEVAFMDSLAKGRRFCIIADSSNSMRGLPLARCKQEVIKTLASLQPESQFYVIFFNVSPVPMPANSWLHGGKENVDKLTPWVQGITTVLGTRPVPAFTRAFQLQPRPDVIFFMTDGLIPRTDPEKIAALNKPEPRAVINTIMFVKQRGAKATAPAFKSKLEMAEKQLRKIADQSGGTYKLFAPAP